MHRWLIDPHEIRYALSCRLLILFILLGHVALIAQRPISNFPVNVLSVCLCVLRPVHCGKTADRIRNPDALWHHRSDESRDEAGSGVWDRSTGRGTFGANLGSTIVTNGTLRRTCATALRRGPLPKLLLADVFNFVC